MGTTPVEVDCAVAGGGITGLYTCLKLNERYPGRRIALFESSNRLGGRIETVAMDGFLAEYGPMRFERSAQPLLMELIDQMGLETSRFAPYMADTSPDALFDLEADEGRPRSHGPLDALELLTIGILRILRESGGDMNDPRDPAHWRWWAGLGEAYYHRVRREKTLDGERLSATGFWNALSRVLSHRAVGHIIRYGTFYHVVHYNPSASEWIIFWLRGLHPGDALVGVRQGTEAVARSLADHLRGLPGGPVSLSLGHRLEALQPEPDGRIRLDVTGPDGPVTVLARNAVLALPWSPLRHLRRCLPERVALLTDGVIPVPLVKCFFVTRDPWWDESTPPQTRAFSVPARELHYYARGEGEDRRGMVMVYGDPPSMAYWKHLVAGEPHLKAELDGDERLKSFYLRYLSRTPGEWGPVENHPEIEALTAYGIRDWSREPFEGGCHIWKPGIDVEAAIGELTAFSLPGAAGKRRNTHICGEAYSDFQGFIEGALRTALAVVASMD